MQNPKEFYVVEKEKFNNELLSLKKQLALSSSLRLVVFVFIISSIYFFFGNFILIGITSLLGVCLFIYLLFRHTNLQYKRDLTEQLIRINQTEIDALVGNYTSLDKGTEFIDASHFYSYDIDLFGKGSSFQYINRTTLHDGKKLLAKTLTENTISDIKLKQKAIKELAAKPKWRQQFSAVASLVKVEHSTQAIINWVQAYKSVFRKNIPFLTLSFSIISVLIIALSIAQVLNVNILLLLFFTGLGISGYHLKRVNTIYQNSDKAKSTFSQYHKLLEQIETENFESKLLYEKQNKIKTEVKKASAIFAELSKLLDALDQRNNLLIAIFGNAFFLRDLQIAYKIEQWIKHYGQKVEHWFQVIAFFDAQNSLANLAFNHPEYTFPLLNGGSSSIKAEMLGHPLLKNERRIDNDFKIESQQFYIITGANMAGKSTFLRTVSLAIIMANMGLPVCAASFEYSPIKLITSMRTSDSLANDESYFFSELKRLKLIVEEIKNDTYFIILDEILKGTNSTDKAIGSKKFVQRLVASNSTGIIATHDLSLCEIEKEFTQVKNYYFDAEIIDDELHFDYKLKEGICQNMNASFLLKKMEIV